MSCASILGRIWLILVNFVLLCLGGGLVTAGALWWKSFAGLNSNSDSSDFLWMHYDWRLLAGILLGVGAYLAVTSIVGCVGGCTRSGGALKLYIFALVLAVLATIGGGAYGIYKIHNEVGEWNSISSAQWAAASVQDKDLLQVAFDCCGWTSYQDAYTGPHVIFDNSTTTITNICADRSSSEAQGPYCQEKGANAFMASRKWAIISVAIVSIFLILSIIAAAVSLKRRQHAAPQGYVAPVQQPLMHKV
ncbi:hypothetical protein HDV00_004558 [Rhizophlyctis rosea]|nr:hypothetical protein HDV00_004558 [Rhizophlyctis rosea]